MSTEQIGFYDIPSDPKLRQELMDTLENCRASVVRVQSEREYIKEALKEIAKKTGIKARDLKKVVTDRAKGSYSKTIETSEKYQDLYESLFPNAAPTAAADVADKAAEAE